MPMRTAFLPIVALLPIVGLAALTAAAQPAAQPVAKPSPLLAIQRPGSPAIQLSQYRGKVVLLAFIHTTCPHCQDLTRELIPIAREYEARGVQVVECAFNLNAGQLVTAFIQQFQPPFPVGWTDNDTVMGYLGRSILDTQAVLRAARWFSWTAAGRSKATSREKANS